MLRMVEKTRRLFHLMMQLFPVKTKPWVTTRMKIKVQEINLKIHQNLKLLRERWMLPP